MGFLLKLHEADIKPDRTSAIMLFFTTLFDLNYLKPKQISCASYKRRKYETLNLNISASRQNIKKIDQ